MPKPALTLAALLMLAAPAPARADGSGSAQLWPCVQPRVASLAPGQMWAGPPLDSLVWREDAEIGDLAPVLAARRTPIEDATARIDAFAKAAGDARKARLTLLFAGVFDQINTRRSRVIAGIENYSRHQVELAARIKAESSDLAKAKKTAATDEDKAKVAEIEKQLQWDTRIYDSRTQAVSAVCESPVLLEQRAFALARAIQDAME